MATITMWYAAGISTTAYLWLFAVVRLGCGQDFVNYSTPGLSIRPFDGPSCSAPPQPSNGQLWLHAYFCKDSSANCRVPEGTELGLGYQLIYSCTTFWGSTQVVSIFCDPPGTWSSRLECTGTSAFSGAWTAASRDFPWHATLYREKRSPNGTIKMFICGATIIQTNFVMTAAHCVYDETIGQTVDAEKFYIMTGNEYRDYDHPPKHDGVYVQRTGVKKVTVPIYYYGLRGNYGSDIALLELQEPFRESEAVSPVYWDASTPDAPNLQNGAIGKVCGFGRTETLDSSPILQAITAPYVPESTCQALADTADNRFLIVKDKFCAGYTNGTAACDGDSGGGLVFEKNYRRYVMGIVSVSLGVDLSSGERTCSKHALTVYTNVSEYTDWIRKVVTDAEQSKQSPSSNSDRTSSVMSSIVEKQSLTSFCVSPEQPTNGQRKLHPTNCTDFDASTNCSIVAGEELAAGTALVYSCNAGYQTRGHPEVYCTPSGSWSNLPECVTSSPSANRSLPVVQDGTKAKESGFPWQASVYEERNTLKGIEKSFKCVGTLIKANLVITIGSCGYNWTTNTTSDPAKLFVMAGNIHPDYDSPLHDPNVVRKSGVEAIYLNCTYIGYYTWSTSTLLLLKQPLQFTGNLQQPLSRVGGYSEAIRDLDLRRNIFIFRTARGPAVCYEGRTNLDLFSHRNVPWLQLNLSSPFNYPT